MPVLATWTNMRTCDTQPCWCPGLFSCLEASVRGVIGFGISSMLPQTRTPLCTSAIYDNIHPAWGADICPRTCGRCDGGTLPLATVTAFANRLSCDIVSGAASEYSRVSKYNLMLPGNLFDAIAAPWGASRPQPWQQWFSMASNDFLYNRGWYVEYRLSILPAILGLISSVGMLAATGRLGASVFFTARTRFERMQVTSEG